MKRTLGLFAKWPTPGQVKTRLAASTSPEFAARLAMAFLTDSLVRYSRIDARRVLAFAPTDAEARFRELISPGWQLQPQSDGNLGDRLTAFFDWSRSQGANRTIVLGTDSPTLPVEWVAQAFDLLDAHDAVIGPATDGGFYLLGLRSETTLNLAGIEWSTTRVLEQTVARLDANTKLALLPPWYDVDSGDDLKLLAGHIRALRRVGHDPLAARTEVLVTSS